MGSLKEHSVKKSCRIFRKNFRDVYEDMHEKKIMEEEFQQNLDFFREETWFGRIPERIFQGES